MMPGGRRHDWNRVPAREQYPLYAVLFLCCPKVPYSLDDLGNDRVISIISGPPLRYGDNTAVSDRYGLVVSHEPPPRAGTQNDGDHKRIRGSHPGFDRRKLNVVEV